MPFIESISLKNFKNFNDLQLTIKSNITIITGNNESGKTNILMGIALLYRSHHKIIQKKQDSLFTINKEPIKVNVLNDFNILFDKSMTISDLIYYKECICILSCNSINSYKLEYSISNNGLQYYLPNQSDRDIQFCFLGINTKWTSIDNEPNTNSTLLSSCIGNMRSRFMLLNEKYKKEIECYLFDLFAYYLDYDTKTNLYIYVYKQQHKDNKIEINLTGNGFKRIFTLLVLLYSLLEYKDSYKLCLIDEIETNFNKQLQIKMINIIIEFIKKHTIQLILTTKSKTILSVLKEDYTFIKL